MRARIVFIGCALVGLLLAAGPAQADAILTYDFNNLANGNLVGQDTPSWVRTDPVNEPGWKDFYVGDKGPDGSKAIYLYDLAPAGNKRSWPTPVQTFNNTVTDAWQAFQFMVGEDGNSVYHNVTAGAVFGTMDRRYGYFGIDSRLTDGVYVEKWYLRKNTTTSSEIWGDATVIEGHWYEVKMDINFSTTGAKGSMFYRDLTLDQETWTSCGTALQNVSLNLPNTSGTYYLNELKFRAGGGSTNTVVPADVIDNYRFGRGDCPYIPIPEPGTLALLVAGLVGLLAYAWRKRR